MKIDMGQMPNEIRDGTPQVGDVYMINGGSGNGRRFRIVIATPEPRNAYESRYAISIIIDLEGNVVSCDKCADHYLERKGKVGTCDLSGLSSFHIDWNLL